MKMPCWAKDVKFDRELGVMTFRIAFWYWPILFVKGCWQRIGLR
jgi:hypothetical protein